MKRTNKFSVCKKDVCVHVEGKNANLLGKAFVGFVLLMGFASAVKALK